MDKDQKEVRIFEAKLSRTTIDVSSSKGVYLVVAKKWVVPKQEQMLNTKTVREVVDIEWRMELDKKRAYKLIRNVEEWLDVYCEDNEGIKENITEGDRISVDSQQ